MSHASLMDYANPTRFMDASARVLAWLGGVVACLLVLGLYLAFTAPPDYQQGASVRIMFVHVPAAWSAMAAYGVLAAASAVVIIFRAPLADVAARAVALPGACFTFLALATGALWGKPIWGQWWVWDARLTSVLVMFFIYLGYMALAGAIEDVARRRQACAIFALAGALNLPIIKFSVDWWNTLHQPASVLRLGAPTLDAVFLWPLLVMAVAWSALLALLVLIRMRTEILRLRAQARRVVL